MIRAALIAALVLLPAAVSPATEPPWLAGMELAAEGHYLLPVGLLARVRAYERSGERTVGTGRGKDRRGGTCGAYQLLSWDWRSRDGWARCQEAMGTVGAWREAAELDRSREWCAAKHGRCPCPWARHNWGDRTALCAALDGGEI